MKTIKLINYEQNIIISDNELNIKITPELSISVKEINQKFITEIEEVINNYQCRIEHILKQNNIIECMGSLIDLNDRIIYKSYNGNSQYNTYDIYLEINNFINFKGIKTTTKRVENIYNYLMEEIKTKGTVLNFGWEAYKTSGDIIIDLYTLDTKKLNSVINSK